MRHSNNSLLNCKCFDKEVIELEYLDDKVLEELLELEEKRRNNED